MVLSEILITMIRVLKHSILSVKPERLLQNVCKITNSNEFHVNNRIYNLNKNVYVVGFGKAVYGMACEIENIIGYHIQKGIISVPVGSVKKNVSNENSSPKIKIFEGAKNNLPDDDSLNAAIEICKLVKSLKTDDLLLVLISGGGSALLSYPIPPITIEEKSDVIKLVASAGGTISELNCLRKKLSNVKGGKLAKLAFPAQVVSFIISDVIGDPIDIISSGPTVPDTDSKESALNIIHKYNLSNSIPFSVKQVLLESKERFSFDNQDLIPTQFVYNNIIGNNQIALEAAKNKSEEFGFESIILSSKIEGFVSDVSKFYINLITLIAKYKLNLISNDYFVNFIKNSNFNEISEIIENNFTIFGSKKISKICLIAGGEPTVKVTGSGKGGRNQELALRIGVELNELKKKFCWFEKNFEIIFFSIGTDGIDGPTDAAGAVSYVELFDRALAEGLDPEIFLENNDSNGFYEKFNGGKNLIKFGHTGTNVMDIHLIVIIYRGYFKD